MTQDIASAGIDALTRAQPSVVEFARTVTLPDGGGGMYDPASHPAQLCIYQAADAGASSITIVKPVQDGGSLASFILILRRIHALAQTGIIAYPTMAAAKDAWTTKVWPILAAQGGTVPQSGGGSRGGASSVVTIPSGGRCILRAAGGRHESGQASATGDCLLDDETDDWPSMRVLRMIERRITKSPDPLIVHVSTVKRDGEGGEGSHILRLYDEGTQTRLHYPCPHCGDYGPYEFDAINYEQRAVACAHCAALITEPQRLAALKKWRRVDGAKSRKFSILWTALDSPFPISVSGTKYSILDGLAEEYEQAARQVAIGDHGLMRQYVRDRFCRPYRADIQTDDQGQTVIPTRNKIAAIASQSMIHLEVDRRETDGDSVHLAHVPAGYEHQAIGVDVQRGGDTAPPRLYFSILARNPSAGRICLTGWGTIALAPMGRQATDGEIMEGLDRLRDLLPDWYPGVPIVSRFIDVNDGGWMQGGKRAANAAVLRWIKANPTWVGIRGSDAITPSPGDIPNWVYRRVEGAIKLRYVCTLNAIRTLHGEICSGSMDLPHALSVKGGNNQYTAIVMHWCGTVEYEPGKWSKEKKDAKHHQEWQKRIDYLHSSAYARCGLMEWEHKKRPKQTPMQPTEKDSDYGAAVW
jgi:hypothetical protein